MSRTTEARSGIPLPRVSRRIILRAAPLVPSALSAAILVGCPRPGDGPQPPTPKPEPQPRSALQKTGDVVVGAVGESIEGIGEMRDQNLRNQTPEPTAVVPIQPTVNIQATVQQEVVYTVTPRPAATVVDRQPQPTTATAPAKPAQPTLTLAPTRSEPTIAPTAAPARPTLVPTAIPKVEKKANLKPEELYRVLLTTPLQDSELPKVFAQQGNSAGGLDQAAKALNAIGRVNITIQEKDSLAPNLPGAAISYTVFPDAAHAKGSFNVFATQPTSHILEDKGFKYPTLLFGQVSALSYCFMQVDNTLVAGMVGSTNKATQEERAILLANAGVVHLEKIRS